MQVTDITKLLDKAPPELITAVAGVVRAIMNSDDPKRAAKRAAIAAAGHAASQTLVERLLRIRARGAR